MSKKVLGFFLFVCLAMLTSTAVFASTGELKVIWWGETSYHEDAWSSKNFAGEIAALNSSTSNYIVREGNGTSYTKKTFSASELLTYIGTISENAVANSYKKIFIYKDTINPLKINWQDKSGDAISGRKNTYIVNSGDDIEEAFSDFMNEYDDIFSNRW